MKNANHGAATVAAEVMELFRRFGDSNYGREAVTQLEHALQAGHFAEQAGASTSLIVASLLHDVGHLLHDLPEDAPAHGIDDCHEELGGRWLASRFPQSVCEPVESHVAAKRYLCTTQPEYRQRLSQPSLDSLQLQGGDMQAAEVRGFESRRYFREAIQLRHWDDQAKIPGLATPPLEHFGDLVLQVLQESSA